jgi:TonB-dependent starch-binding outer membrane protein SusC
MKFHRHYFFFLIFTFIFTFSTFAQRSIKGRVVDENNEPLAGATVFIAGTPTSTLTNDEGKYELQIPNAQLTLNATLKDYADITMSISGDEVNLTLKKEKFFALGYGTIKQSESTSSVVSLNKMDFNQGNIVNPMQLLQGEIAGLVVATPQGGDPNTPPELRLRGITTFGTNPTPLIILDGIPIVSLSLVDANDIETFDVLRDGSAAAIYGIQASRGVILITTKKGFSKKAIAQYNVQMTSEHLARTPRAMTATEYISANIPAGNNVYDIDKGASTNWYKEITRTAISNVHNLSLMGGLGRGGYSASLNWRNQQGIIYDGYQQLNARINISQKALKDRLRLNFNFTTTNQNQTFVQEGAISQASKYIPTAPVFFKDQNTDLAKKYGGYYQNMGGFDQYNPKAIQNQVSNKSANKRYILSTKADLDITKDFIWSSTYALTRENVLNTQYISRYSLYAGGADRSGVATRNAADKNVNFFNSYLNYTKSLGLVRLNLTTGYEYQRRIDEGFGIQAAGFLTDDIGVNSIGTASDFNKIGKVGGGSGKSGERLISFFGRAQAHFNNWGSVSAIVRRDGSSKFAEGKQWGIFPALSTAFHLDRLLKLKAFNQLTLKIGYGITGALPNERYETKFGFIYRIEKDTSIFSVRNPSPDLTWEKKGELSMSLDFAFFKNRLRGSVDFYNRKMTDLLFRFNVPPGIFDYSTLLANSGVMLTKGLDFSITHDVLQNKKLKWTTNLVLSHFSSKLVSLSTKDGLLSINKRFKTANPGSPGQGSVGYTLVEEGEAIGNFWSFQYVKADAKSSIIIRNVKGELITIAEGTDDDKIILGNGLPKLNLGFTNTLSYKNLDFTFFVRGVLGHSIVNEPRVFYENSNGGSLRSYNRIFTKYWDSNIKDGAYSSYHVEKGDFLRLDNITLAYNFLLPKSRVFSKVKVFVCGNNVATWTAYTGINPEVRFTDGGYSFLQYPSREYYSDSNEENNSGNPFAPGIERRNTYFTTRSFTLGANFEF